MRRWTRIAATAAVWAFLLTGIVGLIEAAVHVAGHGVPEPRPPLGAAGSLLAAATLAGVLGTIVGLAALPPAALLARWRGAGAPAALAGALAAGPAVFAAIALGGFWQDTPAVLWWRESVGTLWLPKLGLALVLTLALARLLFPVAVLLAAGRRRHFAAVALVVGSVLLWPWGAGLGRSTRLAGLEPAVAPEGAPNLVLLSIDALRRDRLGCLAPGAPPTPHLDRLAAEGHLFTNAWAPSSWTLPSMATALTGLPPRSLGVDRGAGLPPAAVTLAQAAWRAGWQTAAVAANPFLTPAYGVSRGFEDWSHSDTIGPLAPAAASVLVREANRYLIGLADPSDGRRLVAAARRWLDARRAARPFFLWLHFMDPHLPYRDHGVLAGAGLHDHPWFAAGEFAALDELRDSLPGVAAPIRTAVESLYDGEVTYADASVGELRGALASRGLLDDTWFVVMSDHGEEFFEHGGFEHGHSLLPPVTAVPLIIRPPGGLAATRRDDRAVTLLDLAPSLASAMGWALGDQSAGRASLLPGPGGDLAAPTSPVVLENMLYGPPRQALLRWPDLRVSRRRGGEPVWYDLVADPGALRPAPAPGDSAGLLAAERRLLSDWERRARAIGAGRAATVELDENARRRLRSLGY